MGPRTEPCGTPDDTAISSAFVPFKTTACERDSKKSLTPPECFTPNSIEVQFRWLVGTGSLPSTIAPPDHPRAISISVSRAQIYQTPY